MLKIAEGFSVGQVVLRDNPASRAVRGSATRTPGRPKDFNIRQLPRPLFLAELKHRRELDQRKHVRWCVKTAVNHCENLKRLEARFTQYSYKGPNVVHPQWGPLAGASITPERILRYGRYFTELEDNLQKLACPAWAIPVAVRMVKARLIKGWGLDFDFDD